MKNFFVIITAIIILYGCATVTPTGGTYKSNSGLVWRFGNIGIKINTVKDETTYLELKAETNLITYSADILQVDKTEALESLKSLNRVLYTDSVE